MNPQRRDRPADVPPMPAGSPDPPEVAALEEAMIPSRPLAVYLALATRVLAVLPRFRAARMLAEIMTLVLYVTPVVLAGMSAGFIGTIAPSISDELPTALVAAPFGSSTASAWALFAGIVAAACFLVAKSAIDAVAYTTLRAVVRLRSDIAKRALTRTSAYLAFNLLQLAMATAVASFFAPFVLRLLRNTLQTELPLSAAGILVPGALTLGLFAVVRIFSMFIAAWLTWRPAFVAGALGSSFAAPFRDARLFWSSVAVFAPFAVAAGLVLMLSGLALFLPQLEIAVGDFALRMIFIGTFFVYLQIVTWFDVAIVASVGHQVGEFGLARTPAEAARMRAHSVAETLATNEQQVIVAAQPGFFAGATTAPTLVSFETILGYRPVAGDRDRWRLDAMLNAQTAGAQTSGGATEVAYVPSAPTRATSSDAATAAASPTFTSPMPTAPATPRAPATPTAARAATVTAPLARPVVFPASATPDEAPDVGSASVVPIAKNEENLQGLAALEGSLLPSVLRSAGGAPEVRFKGDRRPRKDA